MCVCYWFLFAWCWHSAWLFIFWQVILDCNVRLRHSHVGSPHLAMPQWGQSHLFLWAKFSCEVGHLTWHLPEDLWKSFMNRSRNYHVRSRRHHNAFPLDINSFMGPPSSAHLWFSWWRCTEIPFYSSMKGEIFMSRDLWLSRQSAMQSQWCQSSSAYGRRSLGFRSTPGIL